MTTSLTEQVFAVITAGPITLDGIAKLIAVSHRSQLETAIRELEVAGRVHSSTKLNGRVRTFHATEQGDTTLIYARNLEVGQTIVANDGFDLRVLKIERRGNASLAVTVAYVEAAMMVSKPEATVLQVRMGSKLKRRVG